MGNFLKFPLSFLKQMLRQKKFKDYSAWAWTAGNLAVVSASVQMGLCECTDGTASVQMYQC